MRDLDRTYEKSFFFFTVRVVGHWHRLLKVVNSPILGDIQGQVGAGSAPDRAVSSLLIAGELD